MNRRTVADRCYASHPQDRFARDRKVLTFIPVADLAILDPIWTPARPTRNHAYLVFLHYAALTSNTRPIRKWWKATRLRMMEGCGLTLRDGLRFHSGEPYVRSMWWRVFRRIARTGQLYQH